MEKTINLKMALDKSITIMLDKEEKHTIPENKRSISADIIYCILVMNKEIHTK